MSAEFNDGPGIRPTFRRLAKLFRSARGNARFLAILFGTPILIILIYSWPHGQSYVVEGRTLGAELALHGKDTLWKLPEATLCKRRSQRNLLEATKYSGTGCNPGIFDEISLPGTEIRIPTGVRILMRADPGGSVLFRRLDSAASPKPEVRLTESESWDEGAILLFNAESWKDVTLLEFAGNVVIGEEAGTGASSYLIEGRYEVRERFWWQYRPWTTNGLAEPTTVVEGTLYRGDYVTFADKDAELPLLSSDVMLTGFMAPVLEANKPGIGIVVSNGVGPSDARLAIRSFGTREVHVAPSWIDRARRDPLLLALTAILGFAVTSLTFALEVRRFGNKKNDPAGS